MRRLTAIVGTLTGLAALTAALGADAPPAVVEARVVDVAGEQGVLGLSAGVQAGVAVGDPAWLVSESGARAIGEVFLSAGGKSAVRAPTDGEAISPGAPAVILRRQFLSALRDRMPPGTTLQGKVLRVPPGRHTAWIDLTSHSGLRPDDAVLVSRSAIPISRGRVKLVDERAALITLQPLVSNALPEAGDGVELWPTPSDAHWGSLTTTVLRVTKGAEGTLDRWTVELAGSGGEGVALERTVDVYRGRQYVGTGQIVELMQPNSRAKMLDVATFLEPAEGDRAIVRPSPEGLRAPLIAPVYKVDGEDCLLTAGELDGVSEGDEFLVRRQDAEDSTAWHDVARLKVNYVAPAHCGASIRPLTSQVAGVQRGDLAERQLPGVEQWRAIGIVEKTDAISRTATVAVAPGCPVTPGAVVAWIPEKHGSPGAAIAIHRDNDALTLYLPPGWGDIGPMARARVDAVK